MDQTQFHLALTHLPIFGLLIGICIYAYGLFRKNTTAVNISLILFTLLALITLPVFLSGEAAEESVEHLVPNADKYIHDHEELAETAVWLMYLLGLMSIFSLIISRRKKQINYPMNWINFAVALVTTVLFFMVGNKGGKIRHTEIRGTQTEQVMQDNNDDNDDEDDDDDDD